MNIEFKNDFFKREFALTGLNKEEENLLKTIVGNTGKGAPLTGFITKNEEGELKFNFQQIKK